MDCVTLNCDQVGDTSNDCMLECGRRAANNEVRDQGWNLVFCAREIGCDLMDLQRGEAGVGRFVDCIAPYDSCLGHFRTCVEGKSVRRSTRAFCFPSGEIRSGNPLAALISPTQATVRDPRKLRRRARGQSRVLSWSLPSSPQQRY